MIGQSCTLLFMRNTEPEEYRSAVENPWDDLSLELGRLRATLQTKDSELVFNEDLIRIMSVWLTRTCYDELRHTKGIKVKSGTFSKREKEFLRTFVMEFLQKRHIPLSVFQYVLRNTDEKEQHFNQLIKPIYREASLGLNAGRPLASVAACIRAMFHPDFIPVEWSEEMDQKLCSLVASYGPRWAVIAKILGVYKGQCNSRYATLTGGHQRGGWSDEETLWLIAAVEELKIIRNRERGKFWIVVSSMLGRRRSPTQCCQHWRESILFHARNVEEDSRTSWTQTEDLKLVSAIDELGAMDESEIKWSRIIDDFSTGLWRFTQSKLRSRWQHLKRRVFHYENKSLTDIVEELLTSMRHLSKDSVTKAAPHRLLLA